MKKFTKVALASAIAIGGIGTGALADIPVPGFETKSAAAFSYGEILEIYGKWHSFNVSDDASNVYVTLKQTTKPGQRFDWRMELQRHESGTWKTIGTRTGYVVEGSPSERTFTGVSKKNALTRVVVYFYSTSGVLLDVHISHQWFR